MNEDFKGFFVSKEDINNLGYFKATIKNAYSSNAPLSKRHFKLGKSLNVLKQYTKKHIKQLLLTQNGNKECVWCKSKCFILEEHHYPISRKDGGKEVVNICGKCHSDFHFLEKL